MPTGILIQYFVEFSDWTQTITEVAQEYISEPFSKDDDDNEIITDQVHSQPLEFYD